jgi:hypothetical protein
VAGNVLYALAIVYNSLPMLLGGRFLGGAGSAEAVNRRLIADCKPTAISHHIIEQ